MSGLLLTGANGQVGWEVARRAKARGLTLHALARSTLDITDPDAVAQAVETLAPEVLVNAAAHTAVDRAEAEEDLALAINRDGPTHLAKACARVGIPLIHLSTDYVFDGTKTAPYGEDDPVAPLGAYGRTKLAGEEAIRAATDRHAILRTAWVHGVHGGNFVKTMLRVGKDRKELRVVDDQMGSPTFAGDLAEAILDLAPRLVAGSSGSEGYGTFHCAGMGATSWYGFAKTIFQIARPWYGPGPRVEAIPTSAYPTPAQRPANSILDGAKLARVHGIRLRPWTEALEAMLAELSNQTGEGSIP
ncbi:MAG: dTDP-4-dehydrorhamnose reductase [Rhodospirillum sp.]|nr:dTDP-4-dehydrorhamnose reductase [Rhodospirillum sp.]MCF8490442.1 dTDP-4-dehydrorhamnose reductase [Rhodospirillum sp.]MCF8500455.1 dTDP-4-dehydrorhamnose reductase [Rhodospirillum sp.]